MKFTRKTAKVIWLTLGLISFGLGTLGTILPLLPTVPLYLLTAFSFARSSDRLLNRFHQTKLYQKHLEPYLQRGGLTLQAKIGVIVFVTLQMTIPAILLRHSVLLELILGILYLGFLFAMLKMVKTVKSIKQPVKIPLKRPIIPASSVKNR